MRDALLDGATLLRLDGLRVLTVSDNVFINSEPLAPVDLRAADALCRYTRLGQQEFGDALDNPAFVAQLTDLINQGYWFFDE